MSASRPDERNSADNRLKQGYKQRHRQSTAHA